MVILNVIKCISNIGIKRAFFKNFLCLLIFRYICWLNKHGINYTLSKKIAYNNVQVCNNDYIILQGKLLCWKYVNFRKNWTASHQYEAQIDQSSSLKVHVSEHCKETWNFLKQTDGIRYCKHIIFSMYDIWWKWFFSNLVWIWISIFLKVPILLHICIPMYLIKWKPHSTKNVK